MVEIMADDVNTTAEPARLEALARAAGGARPRQLGGRGAVGTSAHWAAVRGRWRLEQEAASQ